MPALRRLTSWETWRSVAWALLGEGQQTPSLRCEALRPDGPGSVSGGKDLTEERTVAGVREGRGGERKGEEEEGEGEGEERGGRKGERQKEREEGGESWRMGGMEQDTVDV